MPNLYLISLIQLDRSLTIPLYQQIYEALRLAILDKRIASGAKLPSSRDLAAMIKVSRNTVLNAVDQLIAEGYLEAKVGAGIFVTSEIPDQIIRPALAYQDTLTDYSPQEVLSHQGKAWIQSFNPQWYLANRTAHNLFRNGLPDLEVFPFKIWHKLTSKYLLDQPAKIFDFDDRAGYYPLRTALAQYLGVARAVNCEPDQVMIVTGMEQLIYLAARLLINPGDKVWVEEPGFPGAVRAFQAAGATIIPVPVDEKGVNVDQGLAMAPDARLAYVTPSHQFPYGSTLSLERRVQLLNWAVRTGAWILEDDYDSEYSYDSRPLASLQGLDVNGRVIYLGSFTKVLFPGIRLDYVVLPRNLIEPFVAARTTLDIHIATLNQVVLADFIWDGHFTRHIRRMRKHYEKRRNTLLKAVQTCEMKLFSLGPANCGMHICGWLPQDIDDEIVFEQAAAAGIEALPTSRFYTSSLVKKGIVLGYTGSKPKDIVYGIETLLRIIAKVSV